MRYYIISILLLLVSTAFGADSLVTVAPSGGDYTTVEAALDANEMDIQTVLGDGFNFTIQITGDWSGGPDTDPVTVDGYTTDANNYIIIETDAQAGNPTGTWDTDYYVYKYAKFDVGEAYTIIDGLQLENDYTGGSPNGTITFGQIASANRSILRNCLIRKTGAGTAQLFGVHINNASDTIYVYNNVIYDFDDNVWARGINIEASDSAGVIIYNNTIANCSWGMDVGASNSGLAKNNIVQGCSLAIRGTWANGTDWNSTDSSTLNYTVTGGSSNDSVDAVYSFVSAGGDDWQLGGVFLGTDLSSDSDLSFSTDRNGATRTDPWDAGFDEYISGAEATVKYVKVLK